ncbi:ATP-dependent Clp protease proteolytic subunit 4 [Asimina triloba]
MTSISVSAHLTARSMLSPIAPKSFKLHSDQYLSPNLPIRGHISTASRTLNSHTKSLSDAGNPVLRFELEAYSSSSFSPSLSASQAQETAMRGAESDVMGLLLRERIVFLGGEINDFFADSIISQLLLLDAQDPTKDIRLFINSHGGSLSATMGIYDMIQLVKADVSTIALGITASSSSILLGSGTKGKRFAMPNARIMMHQPLGGAGGKVHAVEIQAKEIMINKKNVIRIISGFTGRSLEQVEKDIDRDRYLSPIEALEYGVIDGVIDENTIIPIAPLPEKVKPRFSFAEIIKDPKKFLSPDVSDDEIY